MLYALEQKERQELFPIFAENEEKRDALSMLRNRTIYFNIIFLTLAHFQSIPTSGMVEARF